MVLYKWCTIVIYCFCDYTYINDALEGSLFFDISGDDNAGFIENDHGQTYHYLTDHIGGGDDCGYNHYY